MSQRIRLVFSCILLASVLAPHQAPAPIPTALPSSIADNSVIKPSTRVTPNFIPNAEGDAFVSGEVILRYTPSAGRDEIRKLERDLELTLLNEFPHILAWHYAFNADHPVEAVIRELQNHPIIKIAEPNYLRTSMGLPTDPSFIEQWALHNTGQQVNGHTGTTDIDIDWPEAEDIFSGTGEVIVAVIDSGVAGDHPELINQIWINPNEVISDGVDSDNNGYIDDFAGWDFVDNDSLPLDENGHGTLVASIIAGTNDNGIGGVGVFPGALIMPLRVANDFGSISLPVSRFIDSTTYAAANGANIINASFGGTSISAFEFDQIDWLDQQGILIIAAAGNGGSDGIGGDNDAIFHFPASYPQPNIISVAAVDRSGDLTLFSNFGSTTVDIAAPGTDIFGADVSRSLTYYEDFETGGAGWSVGHLVDSLSTLDWNLWTDGFGNTWATDSTNFLGFQIPYQSFTDSYVKSPPINLGQVGAQLTYRVWYETGFLGDWLFAEITTDGINWTPIDFQTGPCLTCSPYIGSIRRIDLSAYSGSTVQLRFRLTSDASYNFDGAYIDDVLLTEVTLFEYNGSQYQHNSGTSFSTPIVTGVAAALWSQFPDLTHHQVRDVILQHSETRESLNGKVSSSGLVNAYLSLSYLVADDDSDGLQNGYEYSYNTNRNVSDTDSDGILDGAEVFTYGTDPLDPDTDNDGLSDGAEVDLGLNPLDPNDCPVDLCPPPSGLLKIIVLLKEKEKT